MAEGTLLLQRKGQRRLQYALPFAWSPFVRQRRAIRTIALATYLWLRVALAMEGPALSPVHCPTDHFRHLLGTRKWRDLLRIGSALAAVSRPSLGFV